MAPQKTAASTTDGRGSLEVLKSAADSTNSRPIDRVLSRLQAVTATGGSWIARCPAHDDSTPSLSISEGADGRVLLCCHAGCSAESIVKALGLAMRDLFPPSTKDRWVAAWPYLDENGKLLYTVHRVEKADGSKDYPCERADGTFKMKGVRRVPYRLPQLLALPNQSWIYVAEGEKCADALARLGIPSTTSPGGAGKWKKMDSKTVSTVFCRLCVAIFPDQDAPGRAHAEDVARRLKKVALEVRIVELPGLGEGEDAFDWIARRRSEGQADDEIKAALRELVAASPTWTPPDLPQISAEGSEPSPEHPKHPDEYALTDVGNAERFVARHKDSVRYASAWRQWLVWDGTRWSPDEGESVLKLAISTARDILHEAARQKDREDQKRFFRHAIISQGKDRLAAMLRLAQPYLYVAVIDLDRDPFLLNVANGTLDLKTGQLREHRKEDLLTKLAPVAYDPMATSETWDRFLMESTGGPEGDPELVDFLQVATGYTLTGSTAEEKLFFVHGPAATGKTTFLESLKAALGDYAATADFESFLKRQNVGGPRNDIARLAGARFVVGVEVDEGKKLAEGLVKLLTGGDKVAARFLYHESFEFMPQFKLWLAANHAPEINDEDDAMWRRILRVPFVHVVPEAKRDPRLKSELKDPIRSGPAILAWCLAGCLRWQRDGLKVPNCVTNSTKTLRETMNPLRDFVAEACKLDPSLSTTAKALRDAYERHCKERGESPSVTGKAWGDRLRGLGCVQKNVGHDNVRSWTGIGLQAVAVAGDRDYLKDF